MLFFNEDFYCVFKSEKMSNVSNSNDFVYMDSFKTLDKAKTYINNKYMSLLKTCMLPGHIKCISEKTNDQLNVEIIIDPDKSEEFQTRWTIVYKIVNAKLQTM